MTRNTFWVTWLSAIYMAVACLVPAAAQSVIEPAPAAHDSIRTALLRHGFQSVAVTAQGDELLISYENRRYRFEVRAIEELVELVLPYACPLYSHLVLLPRSHNIPISAIRLLLQGPCAVGNAESLSRAEVETSFRTAPYEEYLKREKPLASANFRAVFEIEPQLRLALGNYTDAFQHQLNILPALQLYLWKGMRVTLQGILPIDNEIDIPEQNWVRPGLLTLNQYFRLPANFFVELSAGYFSDQRYGLTLQVDKVLANGSLHIQGVAGYTGFASYPKTLNYETPERGWQLSELNYFDYHAALTYRPPFWDLRLMVEAGRFLLEENAVRFTAIRQFDEIDLGFFAQKNDRGTNYGFSLSVPLFPPRYMKPGAFQVRPSRHFRYTYFATQRYLAEYQNGNSFEDFTRKMNPIFLRDQLAN